jgi:hypothetical protein
LFDIIVGNPHITVQFWNLGQEKNFGKLGTSS